MSTPDDPKFWEDRGIDPEVRDARPYERWRKNDESLEKHPVRRAFASLSAGQRAFLMKIANQADGLLIHRHAPSLLYPDIYPELRPDKGVVTSITKHWHGYGRAPTDVAKYQVHTPEQMADHIARGRQKAEMDDEFGDHFGVNTQLVHKHFHRAKYVFPPSGTYKVFEAHDHSGFVEIHPRAVHLYPEHNRGLPSGVTCHDPHDDWDLEEIVALHEGWLTHLETKHKGETYEQLQAWLTTPHEHAKTYKNKEQNFAARVDIHPLGRDRFASADLIYFALEGCLKNDSILSAGGAVMSVPSVTLWDTPEMRDPAFRREYFGGKTLVIIPDADWRSNSAVIMQARFLQTYLRHHGIAAIVAAPPQWGLQKHRLKGVDDFLGWSGGDLSKLEVVERFVPDELIHNAVADSGVNVQGIKRDTAVLNALVAHSHAQRTDDGRGERVISAPYTTIARMVELLGTKPKWTNDVEPKWYDHTTAKGKQVSRALDSLEAHGFITIRGRHRLKTRINPYSYQVEWVERPDIVIAEEFHGTEDTQELGSYTPRPEDFWEKLSAQEKRRGSGLQREVRPLE